MDSILSYVLSSVPFYRNTDGNRLQMASNHATQALSIENPELPMLLSGNIEALDGVFYLTSPFNMEIKNIHNNIILYRTDTDKKDKIRYLTVPYYHNINVSPGDYVEKGKLLSYYRNVDQSGFIQNGRNCNVIFNYWDGFVFEDGIVADESVKTNFKGYSPNYLSYEISYKLIDLKQTVRPGSILEPGTVLTYNTVKFYPDEDNKENISFSFRIRYVFAHIPKTKEAEETYRMQTDYMKNYLSEYNVDNVLARGDLNQKEKELIYSILSNTFLPTATHISLLILGEKIQKVNVGDKFTNRHGNKGVLSLITDLPSVNISKVINFQPEIVLNPEGIRRMNLSQLGEMHYTFILKYVVPVIINKLQHKGSTTEEIYDFIFAKFVDPLGEDEAIINRKLYESIGDKYTVLDYIKSNGLRVYVTNQQNQLIEIYKMVKLIESMNIPSKIVMHNKLCSYGVMYMQRLHHTSDSKITFKNQRIGEQEVWALAQSTPQYLQELFIRSDDRKGLETITRKLSHSKINNIPLELSSFDITTTSHTLEELKSLLFALNIEEIDGNI